MHNKVVGFDLPDASGNVLIEGDIVNNFTIHTSLSLSLTVSGGATINVADEPVDLKCTDTIYVFGRENVIDVSNIFEISERKELLQMQPVCACTKLHFEI